jgi:hypothetical protein
MGDLQHAVTSLLLVPVRVVEFGVIVGLVVFYCYSKMVR